jgi:transcriptional regulator with XRE-family HTH domain
MDCSACSTSKLNEAVTPRGQETHPPAGPVDSLVGERIRRFRKEKGLTLRALADLTGRSIGFLSQVERGLSSISLTALRDLAASLGRPMAAFFDVADPGLDDDDRGPVWTLTRAGEESSEVMFSGTRRYQLLSARTGGLVLEPLIVHIAPGGIIEETDPGHVGEEFAYVLKGELLYVIDDREYRLGPGDCMHLRSNVRHRIHNDGDEVTVVVSVLTPRLF